jgi:hypothetical protein
VILEAISKGIETTSLSLADEGEPTHVTVSAGLVSFPEDAVVYALNKLRTFTLSVSGE